jgi:hypothetical protein
MTVTVKPRHPALGAEVHGVDMRRDARPSVNQRGLRPVEMLDGGRLGFFFAISSRLTLRASRKQQAGKHQNRKHPAILLLHGFLLVNT